VSESNALLVIDMQERFGWDIPKKPSQERHYIGNNIAVGLQRARCTFRPIIFIVYGGSPYRNPEYAQKYQLRGSCEACNEAIGMVDFLKHRHDANSFEPVFFKNQGDAFSNPNLHSYLLELGVREVTLMGCNTYSCVASTAIGALKKELGVTLLANCAYDSSFGLLKSQDERDYWREVFAYNGQRVTVGDIPRV